MGSDDTNRPTEDPTTDDRGRVVRFRPRQPVQKVQAFSNLAADESPVADVGKFDRGPEEPDDYGHRMRMNALAVVLLAVLIAGGMWIVDTMTQMRKNQDCVLMGRRNCAQVSTPPSDRMGPAQTAPIGNR
jgi:hypothetical protein